MKKGSPTEVAVAMMSRSVCAVQVGACLSDRMGIFAWGHNHVGWDGYGCHAEAHALLRANRKRLARATMWVVARRKRSGNPVTARPCTSCQPLIRGVGRVMFRDGLGEWRELWM